MESSMEILRTTRRWLHLVFLVGVFSCHLISACLANQQNARGCPCNPIGTRNMTTCGSRVTQCPCRDGFSGRYCTACSVGYFKSDQSNECLPCQCDPVGSYTPDCSNSGGLCLCKSGLRGDKCDQCYSDSHWWDGQSCRSCDCQDYLNQCHRNAQTSSFMCRQCSMFRNFTSSCPTACPEGHYHNSRGICSKCPDCEMPSEGSPHTNNTHSLPAECQVFTRKCLKKCSYSMASQSATCATCHRFATTWNCTKIEAPGNKPAQRGSKKEFRDYYVYIAAGAGALLCTAIVSTVIFIKRRNTDQKPAMSLFSIELKQDDQISFNDVNDLDDVLFLDDSYLMEPSDIFTTSTDTMDERIGYKSSKERLGYKSLSRERLATETSIGYKYLSLR